ncbi:MAG: hypothetical protein ACYC33_03200 [Thermoleophilia bacterium]
MSTGSRRFPDGSCSGAKAGVRRSARRRSTRQGRFVVVLLVLLLPLVAGCKIQMALDTNIGSDGSGKVGVRLAADKEIQDLMASQGGAEGDLFSDFEGSVPEGWDSDSGTDADGTRWVTASRSFDDPSEIKSFLEEGANGPAESVGATEFSLTQEKGLLSVKTVFSATWDMESALAATGDQAPEGMDPSALSSIFEVQNRLTLPGSIKDNNADEVDGNTLIWRPSFSGSTQMSAVSVAYRWPIVGGIAAVAVVLIAAVVIIVLLSRRGRRDTEPLTSSPTGPEGYAPPAAGPQEWAPSQSPAVDVSVGGQVPPPPPPPSVQSAPPSAPPPPPEQSL